MFNSYLKRILVLITLSVFLLPLIARADDQDELRDVIVKKAAFLKKNLDYLEKKSKSEAGKWRFFAEAAKDFVKTYNKMTEKKEPRELSQTQLRELMKQNEHLNTLIPIQLPSGRGANGRFGAYYTKLKYYPEWDKPWHVGPDADVVVQFDDGGHRFVFWRGTNYIPHWVTDNGIWYNNEFNETWSTRGCSEPMSDKQCRYSHVRVIESNPARVVVHWRYALCDVDYKIAWPDSDTGWGDWTDEYYYIYPDAIGTRKIILHTSYLGDDKRDTDDLGHEWHEGIVVYNAFVMPEEVLHVDAVHVANLEGESEAWPWVQPGDADTPTPDNANIVLMNVRAQKKPFVISHPGVEMDAYGGSQNGSRFRWRDHWPTTMEDVTGRDASGRKAAHGSFFHIKKIPVYERDGHSITKVLLHGMTALPVEKLAPLGRSWIDPSKLQVKSSGWENKGYDRLQRAYVISCEGPGKLSELKIKLDGSKESPVVNPSFVMKNWGSRGTDLQVNGKKLKRGQDFRLGHRSTLQGADLVVWIPLQSHKPIQLCFLPVN